MPRPTRETPDQQATADRPSYVGSRPPFGATRWDDAFLLTDSAWQISFASCSDATAAPSRLVGRPLSEALPEGTHQEQAAWATFRGCMTQRTSASFLAHDDLLDVWREVNVHPDATGGLSIFLRDVTARVQLEASQALERTRLQQEVQRLAARATRLEAEVSDGITREADERRRSELEQQLIGIVSHDLRNPLQVVRFSATLGLKAAGSDPRQRRAFERILASSERALGIINTLLDFTRVRFGGGIGIEPASADLHALTAQVVDEVLVTRPERQVSVSRSGDGKGVWDRARLGQVVQNLVGNALQHTTEESRVHVSTHGDGDHVLLEVHNDGPPIAAEDLPRLFAPFQRGKGARASEQSLGLGLHIASHIVAAHGGTIRVSSTAERGTTFSVRLPRVAGADPEAT